VVARKEFPSSNVIVPVAVDGLTTAVNVTFALRVDGLTFDPSNTDVFQPDVVGENDVVGPDIEMAPRLEGVFATIVIVFPDACAHNPEQ